LASQATAPTNVGGNLKSMKGQAEDVKKESTDAPSTLQIVGDNAAGNCSLYQTSRCEYIILW